MRFEQRVFYVYLDKRKIVEDPDKAFPVPLPRKETVWIMEGDEGEVWSWTGIMDNLSDSGFAVVAVVPHRTERPGGSTSLVTAYMLFCRRDL